MQSQHETQLQLIEMIKETIKGQQATIDLQQKILDLIYIDMSEEKKKEIIIKLEEGKAILLSGQKKIENILRNAEKDPDYDERSN